MTKGIIILINALFLLTTLGCGRNAKVKPDKSKIICSTELESVVADLVHEFPQLAPGKTEVCNYFRVVRRVENGDKGFEVVLLSAPDSILDEQKIVVFINSEKKMEAVPFFSNTYRDYWDFEFDTLIPNVPRINTTFDKELHRAFRNLGFTEVYNMESNAINELLSSVLHCIYLNEGDSTNIFTLRSTDNINLPDENYDSAFARLRKNYKAMAKQWHPSEYEYHYNAYFDERNRRVYQIESDRDHQKETYKFKITTYRQDCNHIIPKCGNYP